MSSFINWDIKPFTKTFLAWLFMMVLFLPFLSFTDARQYTAGLVLLGVAPCTAMVLMWVYLAKGNQGLNLVMVAVDSILMMFLFAPLVALLLGVTAIPVPMDVIAFSVSIYVGLPLIAGFFLERR
ncbi:MAG: arsenic resistance protein [Candidatus Bathyarchaeia archaeon]